MKRLAWASAALALPAASHAHGFGALYNLPVPFWLYGWGAGCALVLSFLMVAWFASSARADAGEFAVTTQRRAWPGMSLLSVFLLALCIATGLLGNRDPYRNFSMTFFWVVFALGFTYLTALIGNTWDDLNPWRVITMTTHRLADPRQRRGASFGDWPALALYLAFIWYELFNHGHPSSLAIALLVYTAINFAGAAIVGVEAWFRHGEFFSVFFRLVASTARLSQRPVLISTVVFAMAMLSTTAFDGLRATQWWVNLFWADADGLGRVIVNDRPVLHYAELRSIYIGWETFWLIASPFLYFAAYAACVAIAKGLTRTTRPLRELLLDFGYTLLPIALVYNVTHYATLILTQGLKIVSLASDPFGRGWNLLGTVTLLRAPILPPMGVVWHTQVGLILAGHILSVYLAHRVALRIFPTRRQALLSQLPMLALMICFTVAGLWILAQPLTAMKMR